MSFAHKPPDDVEWNEFVVGNASTGGTLVFGRVMFEMMAACGRVSTDGVYVLYVDEGDLAMPQLHLYVSDDVAAELRARARERGTSVSKLLAEIVSRDVRRAWPEGWLDRVAGAWREPWPDVDDPPAAERRLL